jgi:hypothetical protein
MTAIGDADGGAIDASASPTMRLFVGLVLASHDSVKILVFLLAGALLGVVVASFVVPPALSWYTAPGGLPQGAQIQALVQIPEVIRYSTGRLIRGQLIGGVIGAVVGLALGALTNSRARSAVPLHG